MRKIKLLFLTNELYPDMNANSEIVYRIAENLNAEHNCCVSVLGYSVSYINKNNDAKSIKETIHINKIEKCGFAFKEYNDYLSSNNLSDKTFLYKLFWFIFHPKAFCLFVKYRIHSIKNIENVYYNHLKRTVKKNNYDCIIAFIMPKITGIALSKLSINKPKIIYKLDAWSTNHHIKNDSNEKEKEAKVDKSADAIITTNIVLEEYKNGFLEYVDERKIVALEFPNIVDYRQDIKAKIQFDNEYIHCVFAGVFYKDIRNPSFLIKLISEVIKTNKKIYFHFLGNFKSFIQEERLPINIIDHGKVDSDTALQNMMAADVLINVGNTVLNQMPSKILTYISLGKPILNIVKNPQCPTLKYTNKYALALNILETENLKEEDVSRVKDFILTSKGKTISFEEIRKIYYDCTPEYVGEKVYDTVCKVINT